MPMMVKSKKLVKFFGAKDEDDYFKLDENFIQSYKGKKANFGFNGLGEFVYYRTYSRIKSDGQKETFLDTCRRVVEGCFEIQRRHQRRLHLPWDHSKAQPTAQEMFNLMWEFKFLPPGRGLWMMGTDFMWERGSAALQNCGYISTNDKIEADPAEPFCFLMDMSMLGVGVGFDTKGANRICINKPKSSVKLYKIADSREGWVDSLRQLIHSYTINSDNTIEFDYSDIRPAGVSINGFGGKASGPDILVKLHEMSRGLLDSRIGKVLSSVDIVDLMNFIGSCVVAGNVRRSSELVLGDPNDSDYCNMKNVTATLADSDKSKFFEVTGKLYANGSSLAAPEDFNNSGIPQDRLFPAIKTWNDLNSHRWASNNSVLATVGMNYDHIGSRIAVNGEPGLVWLDNIRDYGRTIDGRQPGIDGRVTGTNPCLSGQMKLLTEKGYVSLYDLWVAGGKKEFCGVDNIESKYGTQNIVGLNGVVRASNVYRTSTNSPLFRVSLDDGSFIDATYSHTFIVDGVRKPLSELVVGDRIPKSPYFYVKIAGSDTSRIISLTSIPNDQTFCLTEPQSNQIIINGHVIGQCAEQSLESSELCVSGDTRIQTKDGTPKISDVVGKEVEVWNGDRWSKVVPRITDNGNKRELYRVLLSDGSFLDCTDNHGWHVQPPRNRRFRRVETKDLKPGFRSVPFNLKDCGGVHEPYAFEHGLVVGDGFVDQRRSMVCICGEKAKLYDLGVNGTWYKPQIKKGYKDPYNRLNVSKHVNINMTKLLRNHSVGLPETIFSWDKESILEFVAGWIETDGNLAVQDTSHAYRIFGDELKIRDLQLLLRRVGINHACVYNAGRAGDFIKEFGTTRTRDVWCCRIPSYECAEIPTRIKIATKFGCRYRKNPKYKYAKQIDNARRQNIISVEKLDGLHNTYCFDEPDNHMGVFGNCLTYQCCLCESFPANHDSAEDYMRTLKFAYLYAKTVTLYPTHNPRTNQVTLRNRRIGLSQSGIVQAFAKFGRRRFLNDFCNAGYTEIRRWDDIYSEWLCVNKSIKVTSVKPSGSVSLLAGSTPGIHYPEASTYWRRVRISNDSVLVNIMRNAGYHVEPSLTDSKTSIIKFAVSDERVRSVKDVSIWEQVKNLVDMQRIWSDNQVSCTIKFKRDEAGDIAKILEMYEDQLKSISFLPLDDHGYAQPPYEPCSPDDVANYNTSLTDADYSDYITEAVGERYCTNDSCELAHK